jgi:hypothetical protein
MSGDESGPYPESEWGRYEELRDREDREYWEDRISGGRLPPRVLSDAEEWAAVPPTNQADWCGKVPIRATSHADGRAVTFPARPCGSWTHQPCAEEKANTLLHHLERAWEKGEHLHLASYRTDSLALVRIRQRRRKRPCPWLWVARSDGWTHYLSGEALPGRGVPQRWVEVRPAAASELLAAAILRLPGVGRVRAHPRGRPAPPPPGRRRTRTYTVHGPLDEGRWEEALRQAAEVIRLKYGAAFKPWEGDPLPDEVPVSAWIEELQTTVINLRGTSRFPHAADLTNPPPEP